MNDRLTVKSKSVENAYSLKALCTFCSDGKIDDELSCEEICNTKCEECAVQTAFNRLAEYENTGLSPNEITDIIKGSGGNSGYICKLSLEEAADKFPNIERCLNSGVVDCIEKKYTDTELEELWQAFGDVPMNPETEVMAADFLHFPKGTHREDIWKWFDEKHSKGVSFLLYGDTR